MSENETLTPAEPEVAQEPEALSGDTIRLDKIQEAVAVPPEPQDDAPFQPIVEEPAVEPFSENWEPEYDAPIGEYTPPITFKPKSRLQQLRAKLVAGPEKKYYELIEQGLGKLQSSIFLCLLLFAVALCTTVLHALGLVSPERLKLLVFVQILCMLLCGLLGCYRMLEGLGDILKLHFTLNTWLAMSFIVCCVDGVLCLQQQRISCCAVFCLEMIMAQLAAYHKRVTRQGQMDTLRKASDMDALVAAPELLEGKPGFATVPGDPDAFMETYETVPVPERILHWYSLISFLVCGMFGLFGLLREYFDTGVMLGAVSTGMQITAGTMLLSMPATIFITLSRPEKLLNRRLHKLGAVLCGWKGTKAIPARAVFPLRHNDLFPAGSVKFNGVKFLGKYSPDTVVCYAASLVHAQGGSLEPLLEQLLSQRSGRTLPAEDLHVFDGGLMGVVDDLPITMGTMDFMTRMGVQLPQDTKLPHGICITIDGELSGIFALVFSRSRGASAGIRTLCSYRTLRPVLAENDFMFSRSFLARQLKSGMGRLLMPESQVRSQLAAQEPPEDAVPIALLTREGLAPKAFCVTGGKMLRLTWYLGVTIHLLGGILGLAAAAALTLAGGQHLLTPVNLLLYSLIWMVPGFLITQWTKAL